VVSRWKEEEEEEEEEEEGEEEEGEEWGEEEEEEEEGLSFVRVGERKFCWSFTLLPFSQKLYLTISLFLLKN
jgi:hypothetical protein